MQSTAIAPSQTAKPPQPAKDPRISKRLRKALHLLETGECSTQRAAAERAGMSEFQLSRRIRDPQIQAFIARKRSENIAVGSLRASKRYVELIEAKSEHVAAQVSERILTSEGVLKSDASQVSVAVGVSVGYVIDLSGHASPPTITVSHDGDA